MIEAVGTKIIVEKLQKENTSVGGIVLTMEDNNPLGKILSIGSDVKTKTPELELGQEVYVEWRNSLKLEQNGKSYYVLDNSSVYGISK
jgi:co-chaperonin GroES (HSP10)